MKFEGNDGKGGDTGMLRRKADKTHRKTITDKHTPIMSHRPRCTHLPIHPLCRQVCGLKAFPDWTSGERGSHATAAGTGAPL